MVGVLYFLAFIFLGVCISNRLLQKENSYIRIWGGIIIGLLGLMWCVVPFSFFMGFKLKSHVCALFLMIFIFILVRIFFKETSSFSDIKKIYKNKPLLIVFLFIFILTSYLFHTHILLSKADGIYVGQSTFGDLCLHTGIASGLAQQQTFPPQYTIFPGNNLSYPFLTDLLSGSLNEMGMSLRWSILLPSFFMTAALIGGFIIFAYALLKKKSASILAAILFFFNGGLGFIYFIGGSTKNFTRIFTEFYQTPTNLVDNNIRWTNVICDMIIPQRTTLAGWTILVFLLWIIYKAIKENNRKYFIMGGILSSLLPMVHTHSFLALGLICIAWFIVYFISAENKLEYFINWVCFGIPILLIAFPQLLYWTFPQSSSGHFLQFHFDWANDKDSWLWFWIKNVGVVFVLLPFSLFNAKKEELKTYSGAVLIFIIADLIVFQPNYYDNNKLFYIWYIFTTIIVAGFVVKQLDKLKNKNFKITIVTVLILLTTISAALTIGREAVSNYRLFSREEKNAADYILKNTAPNSLFLTATNHTNLVSTLTGRNILCGSPSYLYFHGLNYTNRYNDVDKMYTDMISFKILSKKYKIDYVLIGDYEKGSFKVNEEFFKDTYPCLYNEGGISIYKVR